MEKNKLGIVINTTNESFSTSGFRKIYSYNNEGWDTVVRDTGAELKRVTNITTSTPLHFIQFESDGCCYCIMQSTGGRRDYLSAWIFIHKDIVLPKGKLSSIIQKVEKILSLNIEEREAEIDRIFEEEYNTKNSPCYSVSSGDTYAVRYYGNGTSLMCNLDTLLDENHLYQSEYCKYKSVFLINKESNMQVSDAKDLSDTKFEKNSVIELPPDIDGFKHDQESNCIRLTEGKPVEVKWTKSGYKTITKQGTAKEELLIDKSDICRTITYNMFLIVDDATGKSLEAEIIINNSHCLSSTNPSTNLREGELKHVNYTINVSGYQNSSDNCDLSKYNETDPITIRLKPNRHTYECRINTKICDCPIIRFTIDTQYQLYGDEIPGFEFEGIPSEKRVNQLKPKKQQASDIKNDKTAQNLKGGKGDAQKPQKKRSPWKIPLLVILLICGFGVAYQVYERCGKKEIYSTVYSDPQPGDEWDIALEYLKSHDKDTCWVKNEMESYQELKGVYKMIKDYEFDELRSFFEKHYEDLMDLEIWSRLYEKISACPNQKGSYPEKEGKINIETYLNKDFDSMQDVSAGGETSEGKKEGNSPTDQDTGKQNSNSPKGQGKGSTGNGSTQPSENAGTRPSGNSNSSPNSNGNSQGSNI